MRKEERTQRLTRAFYRLLLHKMFQSIAAFSVPSSGSRATTASEGLFSANSFAAPDKPSQKDSRRSGLFGRLLEALHHSRRLQAQDTLRQYRHLIDSRWHRYDSRSDIGGQDNVAQ